MKLRLLRIFIALPRCLAFDDDSFLQTQKAVRGRMGEQEQKTHVIEHAAAGRRYALENRSFIHLLSPGRVGSCFTGDLFKQQGLPYIFEPDNNDGWGRWESASVSQEDRIRCIYSCDNCEEVAKNPTLAHQVCNSNRLVAIKTVGGLSDFSILSRMLPSTLMQENKFLVLFRDPRGMLHSVIKSKWYSSGMESDDCSVFLLQYLAAKELALVVPKENIRAAFFEQWSQNVEAYTADLFAWARIEMSKKVRNMAISNHKGSALAWVSELSRGQINAKTHAHYCPEFIQAAGYPIDPPTDLAFVSKLRDPSTIGITSNEILQLKRLRSEAALQMSSTHTKPHPTLEAWLPEDI